MSKTYGLPKIAVLTAKKELVTKVLELTFPRYSIHHLDEGTWYQRLRLEQAPEPTPDPGVLRAVGNFVFDQIYIGARSDVELKRTVLRDIPPEEGDFYLGLQDHASAESAFTKAWDTARQRLDLMEIKDTLRTFHVPSEEIEEAGA